MLWLQDAGLAEYKLGNLEEARQYDDQALQSALTLSPPADADQIANIETNLALLLYQQGQFDAAKTYSDRALLAIRNSKDADVVAYAKFLQGLLASSQLTDPEAERLLTEASASGDRPYLANGYRKRDGEFVCCQTPAAASGTLVSPVDRDVRGQALDRSEPSTATVGVRVWRYSLPGLRGFF